MYLLADLGNTRLKWACYADGELVPGDPFMINAATFEQDLSNHWRDITKPQKICVSSDIDESLTHQLQQWAKANWCAEVTIIKPERSAYGVNNGYDDPIKLGSDRWAALVAVRHSMQTPAVIVDCGTVITVDAITREGNHLAGAIIPGTTMMREALSDKAHKLEPAGMDNMGQVVIPAQNTLDGINNGITAAAISSVDMVVDKLVAVLAKTADANNLDLNNHDVKNIDEKNKASPESNIKFIISGGDANSMQSMLKRDYTWMPNLVFDGLAVILDHDL